MSEDVARRWKKGSFPTRHKRAIESMEIVYPRPRVVEAVRDLLGDPFVMPDWKFLACLLGEHGTGKTQMATCLAYEVNADGGSTLYTTAAGMFSQIRDGFGEKSSGESEAIKRFVTPHFLTIDEMDSRIGTEYERLVLRAVIDGRYCEMRPTVMISNLDIDGFSALVGEAIIDRVREAGFIAECDWPSYRQKKRPEPPR